jgi:hypothetical protein
MYPAIMELKYTDLSAIVKKENLYWNSQQILTHKTNYCAPILAQLLCDCIEEHNLAAVTNLLLQNKLAPQFVNLTTKKGVSRLKN